ncbi:hypothetical protein DM793_17150 [Paenarthrobacter nitroguajacolicus]|uniref:hypothetical protein n=1 Tax=Paenarthrobacter nitroguajacolicus TaxID=211146 RepID=UPI0015B8BB62|nr:hypothetical protein [Paenarthrobacter nitroguajacolicus]NWL12995.1 hypothetical protein [Paenarthrobacter nitroguajacolicus]
MITTRRYFGQVDRRSRFTTVSMGWRTASDGVPRLRDAVTRAGEQSGPAKQPVSVTWTPGDGAVVMTATLPEVAARSWIEDVMNTEQLGIFGDPVLAVVGTASVLEDLEGRLSERKGAVSPPPQQAFRSTMKQTTAQGFEQTFIIGQDPAANVGFAATFLAICLIAGGPGTLLPDAIQKSGYQAILQAGRGLQGATATVTWQVIASRPNGSAVLETALSTVAGFSVAEHLEAVEQAREFARTNLNRAWQSPLELARSLAHYEVMGWGGELVRNPDTAVDHVAPAAIEQAVESLVRPIKEILGRS